MTIAARRTLARSALVAALVLQTLAPINVRAAEAPTSTPTPSTTAPAGTPPTPTTLGPDEVLLQGGGFVRGTIVEVVPDVKVVIVVDGTGERREIAMDQVVEVQRGKHATTPPAEPPPVAKIEPTEPSQESSRGRPFVHIELTRQTRRPVKLFEINSEIVASGYNASLYGMNFSSVCTAPCDKVVDGTRGQDFFLGMSDTGLWTASRKLSLEDRSGRVTLRVKPGNRGMRIAGAILLGIGIGCTIGGAIFMIPTSTDTLRKPGIALLAVGIPTFAAGLPMMLLGRTRYEWADRDTSEDP